MQLKGHNFILMPTDDYIIPLFWFIASVIYLWEYNAFIIWEKNKNIWKIAFTANSFRQINDN